VSSGLYLGYHSAEDFSPQTRLQAYSFWSQTTFLLEGLLFILIGLQFPAALDRLGTESMGTLVLAAVAVSVAVIATRMAFALATVPLPLRERAVVGWA